MRIRYLLGCIFLATASMLGAGNAAIDPSKGCKSNPLVVDKCFMVKGNIMAYNGSPTIRIMPQGSKKLLGVLPSENEIMPSGLKSQINFNQSVFAVMEACPFSKFKPDNMQYVCIESAKNIQIIFHKNTMGVP